MTWDDSAPPPLSDSLPVDFTADDATPSAASVESAPATVTCWRCALLTPQDAATCIHCGAQLARKSSAGRSAPTHDREVRQIKLLLAWFTLLLGTGIAHSVVLQLRFGDALPISPTMAEEIRRQVLIVEIVDTIVVVAAFLSLGTGVRTLSKSAELPFFPWLAGVPLLAALLGANFGYHWVLREWLHLPQIENEILETRGWLTFATVCVQPAIVEELFCRGLALGVLRRVVGKHAAVAISATMFALLHVAVVLSMPYLFVFGLVVGYLRISSGTIWLPIAFHFLHNLGVLLYEW